MTTKFETGRTYYTRSLCDYDCIIAVTVVSRTAKTVTCDCGHRGVKTFRPRVREGVEQIQPWGRGSMMPIIDANDTKELRPTWEA